MIVAIVVLIFLALVNTALFFCLYKVFQEFQAKMDLMRNVNGTIVERFDMLNKEDAERDKLYNHIYEQNNIICKLTKSIIERYDIQQKLHEEEKQLFAAIEKRYSDLYDQYADLKKQVDSANLSLNCIIETLDEWEFEDDEDEEDIPIVEHKFTLATDPETIKGDPDV